MRYTNLDRLPKKTLIQLAKMYSRNWQSLDANWFGLVEENFGLETAARLDLKSWERQSVLEAERIKKVLQLNKGGLSSVLTVLSFMSWQLTSPLFELEIDTPERVVLHYPRCAVHESRNKKGKPVFPCKTMKTTLLTNIARVVEPRAAVRCISCPPDPPRKDCWCKWELTLR
ncbi:MAG: hypothetical protein FJ004_03080 [Chloroflexi bacterium]|nr:hypothetical protein [Chloroflexota bacterium]